MMAGMRDYTNAEFDLVRKSFGGCNALRDRCYFETGRHSGKLAYRGGQRPIT
jgi:hypothetical protein